MSARKLATEIDRVLKRVQEGIDEFDETWDKVYNAPNQNLKEKYEGDLKKEIKKLQRYRDQIKSWASSNDVKDKRPLLEARKDIETKMEQFKICEKQTKTKAYSKEALQQSMKRDKKDGPKYEMKEWIDKQVERIKEARDSSEKKLENYGSKKNKKRFDKDTYEQLQEQIERHNWHLEKLNYTWQRLDKDLISVAQVKDIQEGVEFYIESLSEIDIYHDEFLYEIIDEDKVEETSNDNILLDEELAESETIARNRTPSPPVAPSPKPTKKSKSKSRDKSKTKKSKSKSSKKSKSSSHASTPKPKKSSRTSSATPSSTSGRSKETRRGTSNSDLPPLEKVSRRKNDDDLPELEKSTSAPASIRNHTTPKTFTTIVQMQQQTQQQQPRPQPPPHANVPHLQPQQPQQPSSLPQPPSSQPLPIQRNQPQSSSALTVQELNSTPSSLQTATSASSTTQNQTPLAYDTVKHQAQPQSDSQQLSAIAKTVGPNNVQSSADQVNGFPAPGETPTLEHQLSQPNSSAYSNHTSGAAGAIANERSRAARLLKHGLRIDGDYYFRSDMVGENAAPFSDHPLRTIQQLPGQPPRKPQTAAASGGAAASVGGTTTTGAAATPATGGGVTDPQLKHLQNLGLNSLSQTHNFQMLEASHNFITEPSDSERQKQYVPRNPYNTPVSFPTSPAKVFDDPTIFSKFDTDTLFFIFYFQQGTYQQYLAARELKKQAWRYHKKYLTWFQRHDDPKITTDDFEQGTYVYFDYDSSWCQRIKSDFTFEYAYLEDELK